MSLNVYFVRHGQSEANLRKEFYDDAEAGLTLMGKAQAAEAGELIKNFRVRFVAVYCSPYRRAKDTCALALESVGLNNYKIIYDDRLMERQFDGLFGKEYTKEQYIELYDYSSDLSERVGVETLECLEARARDFVDEMKAKYSSGNILVFSHGVLGLAVETVVNGRPASGSMYDMRLLKNCEIRKYELK